MMHDSCDDIQTQNQRLYLIYNNEITDFLKQVFHRKKV